MNKFKLKKAKKIFPSENFSPDKNSIIFRPDEWECFKTEINDMIQEGRQPNFEKAVKNAHYLAEIDRRIENVESGKNIVTFTADEWEKFVNGQNI